MVVGRVFTFEGTEVTLICESDAISKTDFAKLDSHDIRLEEYDDLPEITDDEFESASLIVPRGDGEHSVELARLKSEGSIHTIQCD